MQEGEADAPIGQRLAHAIDLHEAGELSAAEAVYRRIIATDPHHSDSLHLLGVIAYQTGDHAQAVVHIEQAIAVDDKQAPYHYNLGNALAAQAQTDSAIKAYRRALNLQPAYPEAAYNLGNVLNLAGLHDQAAESYRSVLRLRPDHAKALNNLGNVLRQQGAFEAAEACYHQALASSPEFAEAQNNLGTMFSAQGRLDDAIACFRAALNLRPDMASTANELGNALLKQQQPAAAMDCYRQALAVSPAYAEAHNNLGAALAEQGAIEEAAEAYHRALAIQPDFAKAHYNLGITLREQRQLEAATDSFRRAIALQPAYAEACNNLGVVLLEQGHVDEAIEHLRASLQLQPDEAATHHNLASALTRQIPPDEAIQALRHAVALQPNLAERHFNLAAALLTRGELKAGWDEHEWRWHTAQMCDHRRPFTQPQWQGEPAVGQRLLIHAEQGFGDTLQFCRYAPLAAARGLVVTIEVPKPLQRLVATLPGITPGTVNVVVAGEALPEFDLHCPMLSLPRVFATSLADVPDVVLPGGVRYLRADPDQVAAWRERLDATGEKALRIGLVWAGNPRPHMPMVAAIDRRRSMPVDRLQPVLALPGCQFFSLQKDPPAANDEPLPDVITDFMTEMVDFADTAALIVNLDLVISVDTAVAHLAAALGKPVWLLDRFDACWRWLRGRRDSPWYPGLRIYRQPKAGDWDAVIADVVADLSSLLQKPDAGPTWLRALKKHHAGNLDAAELDYRAALHIDPMHADALHSLGVLAEQTGRPALAVELITKAVTIQVEDGAYHYNLGVAFTACGRGDEAIACYRRAAALRPEHPPTYNNLAIALRRRGDTADAAEAYRALIALRPNAAPAHADLGRLLMQTERFDDAAASFRAALTCAPDDAETLNDLALAVAGQGRHEEAADIYRQALALRPAFAEAHNNLGISLRALGQLDDALACTAAALSHKPDYAEAHHNQSIALRELACFDDARDAAQRAVALRADSAEMQHNLGIVLDALRQYEPALAAYRNAIASRADYAPAHHGLGMALLASGDLVAGWQEYEWRWQTAPFAGARRDLTQPQWRGEPGQGRTLLIHAEQGFGDTLQFCRYASLAAERGWRVVLEVPQPLVRLMHSLAGVHGVIAQGGARPAFDRHCPMLSLPHALQTTLATIPGTTPYLFADAADIAAWRDRLGAPVDQGLRIGLVWAGAPRPGMPAAAAIDRRRSLDPDLLAPLFEQSGATFYSLQKPAVAADPRVIDLMQPVTDFADTAALIANLDLVIAVDTAVAHLAAALGKPVWLLDRFDSCWRWLRDRRDSPWYPGLRIYRQPAPGAWQPVITEVAADLTRACNAPFVKRTAEQAVQHHRDGRLEEAEGLYREVLAREADHPDSLHLLGVIADQTGRHDQAIELIRQAIARTPREAVFHYNLGIALAGLGRLEDAIDSYEAAVLLNPRYAEAHNNLALACAGLGRFDAAIRAARAAIAIRPDHPNAYNNLGIALREAGRVDEAVESYRAALARRADYPEALTNLAISLKDQGHLGEAIACARRAIALRPGAADLHYNLATSLLTAGSFTEGWEEFEWRWQTAALRAGQRGFTRPQWRGEPAAGQILLIHSEQGLGDALQFCRYATLAAERGLTVILEVQPPLLRLLSALPGVAQVIATGEPLPDYDLHCPMLSLPLAFATTLESIPAQAAYLHADSALVAVMAQRLRARDLPPRQARIGLVWAGNPRRLMPAAAAVDRRRSIDVQRLAPLFALTGIQLFSLQKDQVAPAPLHDLMAETADFADTAALIAQLDLVIAVDTAVAHLAAALGKPVWLLDRFDSCWRWLRDRRDSPWYPSLRIYRQPAAGDWAAVIETVIDDLVAHFGAGRCAVVPVADALAADVLAVDGIALFMAGVAHGKQGQLDEAVAAYRKALEARPAFPEALHNLGEALGRLGRTEEAVQCFRQALAVQPAFPEAANNLGVMLARAQQPQEAVESYRRALSLRPDYADAYNNLGVTLAELRQLDEAVAAYRNAIGLRPDFVQAHSNLGLTLCEQGHIEASLASHGDALALAPTDPLVQFNRSIALLSAGDLPAGLAAHEARWQLPHLLTPRGFAQPQWRGEPAAGQTLLIHPEGGFGDIIMFARFAPLAAARGLRVCVEAPPPLVRLLHTLAGVDRVIESGTPLPAFDLHCPVQSLGHAFGVSVATIPAQIPYLHADPAQIAMLRDRLDAIDAQSPRVGLVWAGNPLSHSPQLAAIDQRRSMPPEHLDPLFDVPGMRFISLQKPTAELGPLLDLMDGMNDFADTAALIANLDLVIAVDTAVAHLAGAMGKPVWLMDRFDACWRWLPNLRENPRRDSPRRDSPRQDSPRQDSPWYPTLRIYRQPVPGAWDAVVREVAADLARHTWQGVRRRQSRRRQTAEMLYLQGIELAKRGELDNAATCYRRAVKLRPGFAEAHHNFGTVRIAQGQIEAAIACYQRALAIRNDFAAAHSNLGAALAQAGRGAEAIEACTAAIALQPDYADAHFNLGTAYRQQNDIDQAAGCFRQALALRPDFRQAHLALAEIRLLTLQFEDAIAAYRGAVALAPEDADAQCGLAVALARDGQRAEALECHRRAVALRPDKAELHHNLGNALRELGAEHLEEAIACYRAALDLSEEFAQAHTDLGTALWDQGHLADATTCHRRALQLRPDFADACNNLGAALIEQGEVQAAIDSYRRALEIQPDFKQVFNNLGMALRQQGNRAEAIDCYRRSIALGPEDAETHVNLAMALLAEGDFVAGWQEYEWRWRKPRHLIRPRREFSQPAWRGAPAAGQTLLIYPEQGFGDTLQFCRYATLAARQGTKIVLEAQKPLVRLLRSLDGVTDVVATGDALPAFDIQCPVMSLPLAFGTTLATIPAPLGYLKADPADLAAWQTRLDGFGRGAPRIGLVWAGNPRLHSPRATAVDHRRSMPASFLWPLFDLPGLRFFSLQKEYGTQSDLPVIDLMEEVTDFADTAALIANLDLVIAVDTAVAHLAAALGKPVWLLDRFDSCWRWLHDRLDSPWYPTLRIYRQPEPGNWAAVIADVTADLRQGKVDHRTPGRLTPKTTPPRSWTTFLKKLKRVAAS